MAQAPDQDNYALALYVDSRALLDLIARAEGGLTLVERVTTRTSRDTAATAAAEGEAGLPGFLSLLKFNAKVGGSVQGAAGKVNETSADRYHTEGSLLLRLRDVLREEGRLSDLDASVDPAPGDFVELKGVLAPNPFTESLRSLLRLGDLAKVLSRLDQSQPSAGPGKGKRRHPAKPQDQASEPGMKQVLDLIAGLLDDAAQGESTRFVLSSDIHGGWSAVMELFPEYARDPSFRELAGIDVRVLAKVVRVEGKDGAPVSLLEGSGLALMGDEVLEPLLDAFGNMGQYGINLENFTTEVKAPVLRLVPVGVYV